MAYSRSCFLPRSEEFRIDSPMACEFSVGASLQNLSIAEDQNLVRGFNRRQAVGDNQNGLALNNPLDGGLNGCLERRVHVGCGFIEDQ